MEKKNSIVSKIESLSCVDGTGLRSVIFLQGCNLKCGYCHNPEMQSLNFEKDVSPQQLASKLQKFFPYIKKGGVTFSGGEPLVNCDYVLKTIKCLRKFEPKLNIAIETSASVFNSSVKKLLRELDLIICDIKATTNQKYQELTQNSAMTLDKVVEFLSFVDNLDKEIWIRQVVVPGFNNTKQDILALKKIVSQFKNVKKVELLPFVKLCKDKYIALDREFPFDKFEEMKAGNLKEIQIELDENRIF